MKTFNELLTQVLSIIPNASVGEDNDGQLIIYTNLTEDEDGNLSEMSDERF